MHEQNPLVVFSGRAHPQLTDRICDYLQIPRGDVRLYNFSDGERAARSRERAGAASRRSATCPPVSNNLMEMLIC
jgi:ribose-phosphate pyrophosphokinase